MTEEQAKFWTVLLALVAGVAALILVVDIGIKNQILAANETFKGLTSVDGQAERATNRASNNGSDDSVLRVGIDAAVEDRILPQGGHDGDKVPFRPRSSDGRFVPRTPRGHTRIPASDEQVGA